MKIKGSKTDQMTKSKTVSRFLHYELCLDRYLLFKTLPLVVPMALRKSFLAPPPRLRLTAWFTRLVHTTKIQGEDFKKTSTKTQAFSYKILGPDTDSKCKYHADPHLLAFRPQGVEKPFRSSFPGSPVRWSFSEARHEGFFDLLAVVNLEGWKTKF